MRTGSSTAIVGGPRRAAAGIVLVLGAKKTATHVDWEYVDSVAIFLRAQSGWVIAGGAHSTKGEPGTLDEHLRKSVPRDIARWFTRVLRDAGVVEVSAGTPLSLRLSQGFSQ